MGYTLLRGYLWYQISTKEFLFAEKEGSEALETMFDNEDTDILD